MKITYLGPSDQIDVAGVGTVNRGKSIEAPDDLAGRPPEPRLAEAMVELGEAIAAHDHELAQKLRDEIAGLDYGDGLLAQVETWKQTGKKQDDTKPSEVTK